MLSAFPASGKSTWANAYKNSHDNVVVLNSDDIRMEITHGDYQTILVKKKFGNYLKEEFTNTLKKTV